MKLFDRKGNPVEVPDDQVAEALASGQVGAPEGTLIPVRMDGQVGTVPVEHLTRALSGGAEVVSPKVYESAELQAKYGDAGHGALALGTEALNTATLGASNAAIRAFGGKEAAEKVRKSQEANPTATGIGTAVGIAAPIAADIASGGTLTPELAAAEAARVGERGVARGAAEAAAAKALPEAATLARAEAPSAARALPRPVVEGALEEAPRALPSAGAEMAGEVVPPGLPGRPAFPGPATVPEVEAELFSAPGAVDVEIPQARRAASPYEVVGESAAKDAPGVADVVSPRPPALPPSPVEEAARAQRLSEAAEVVEEARASTAATERASAQAAGKGLIRETVDTAVLGPNRLVNGVGESVESAVRSIVGKDAETALGRIAQDAVVKAARGAAEGGIYSVGSEAGHQFLQDDPDLSGERLATAWFNGAVLGGGFGLATGALGRGAKEAIGKVVGNEGIAKFLSDKAGEHMWHAAGPTKKMTAEAEKWAGGVAKVGNLIRNDAETLLGRMPRSKEDLLELSGLMKDAGQKDIGTVLNRLDEDGIQTKRTVGDVFRAIDTSAGELKGRAADAGPLDAFKRRVAEAAGAIDPKTGDIAEGTAISFKQLRDFRVTADENAAFTSNNPNAVREEFRKIRRRLEDYVEEAALPHIDEAGGNLHKDYKAGKARYQAGLLLEKAAESGIAGAKNNQFFSLTDKIFGGAAAGVVGHAAGPLGGFVAHEAAELASKYVRKNFDFVVSDVLAKLANVAQGAHVLDAAQATSERMQKRVGQGMNAFRKALDGKPTGDHPVLPGPKTFEERRALLLNIAAQHEDVLSHLQTVTSPLDRAAPAVATALHAAALRTVVYLMDALPKPPPPPASSLTPRLDEKSWQPSDPQKAAFNRKWEMAVHPELAPALVAAGAYTPDHDHSLTTTNPKMKADMAAKMRQDLDRRTKIVPPRIQSSVKLFLGVPAVDKDLGRMFQSNYQTPQPAKSGLRRPLKLSDNKSLP